jgi:hypothetical protein
LLALYEELVERYPELDDAPERSPFVVAIERSPRALLVNIVFSRAREVAHAVKALAMKHDVDVFDPQSGRLHRAS